MAILNRGRRAVYASVPVGVGILVAFQYFLQIGRLTNDHFVMLARAYQVMLGAWPIRDFFDPGMPLAYLAPAFLMWTTGEGLLAEVVLVSAYFAVAVAVTVALVRRASGSTLLACLAAGLIFFVPPRAYNTSKVMVAVVSIAMGWWYADRPSARRLALVGVWAGIAFLFRHDYAVYLTGAVVVLVVTLRRGSVRVILRDLLLYGGVAALVALPWFAYVQWAMGVPEYLASASRYARAEAIRTVAFGRVQAGLALIPLAALLVARRTTRLSPAHVIYAAVLVCAIEVAFLRGSIEARLPDVIAPILIGAAVVVGALPRRAVLVVVLLASGGLVTWALQSRARPVPPWIWRQRADVVMHQFETTDLETVPVNGLESVLGYLSRCTAPSSAILVSGFAPQLAPLAGRRFAGGTPDWLPGYYTDPADIARARRWLVDDRVAAAVMVDGAAGAAEFVQSWPTLADVLRRRGFRPYPLVPPSDDVEVWLPSDAASGPRDAASGLPCRTPS